MQDLQLCSIVSGTAPLPAQRWHRHSLVAEIWWLSAGTLEVEVEAEAQRFTLVPHELLVLPTGTWHRLGMGSPCHWQSATVKLPLGRYRQLRRIKPQNPGYISALFGELERLHPENAEKSAQIVSLVLQETESAHPTQDPEAALMAQLQHGLEESCHLPFSLEAAAQNAGMSKYHFSRKFKQACGQSPLQFVISCRMERAKKLLEETALPLASIAAACGYHSPTQFHALFTRAAGETPMRYRKAYSWQRETEGPALD
ncbi:helix-turn-helix domain-containing protein [Planococcus sp. SIMBA_160]